MSINDAAMQYFVKLGLDASGFMDGIAKSQKEILAFYRYVTTSMDATMQIFNQVMAFGQQFIDLANKASEFVGVIDRLSVTTGMSNEQLQRLSNVARYADSDVSSLAQMVNELQLNLSDQGETGEKARAIMDRMGVSYQNADGSLRSMNEVFPEMIEGLGNLEPSADRVSAANNLVGKGYEELAGYITLGKDGIEQYYNSANTLTDEQQKKLREYEESVKDLDATLQTLGFTVGSELAPSFSEWAGLMNDIGKDAEISAFFGTLNDFLTNAARGFHIMGAEAKFAWQILHGDITGAEETLQNLTTWTANKARDDALKAAGFKTDGNGNAVAESSGLSKSGTLVKGGSTTDLSETPFEDATISLEDQVYYLQLLSDLSQKEKDAQEEVNRLLRIGSNWAEAGYNSKEDYNNALQGAVAIEKKFNTQLENTKSALADSGVSSALIASQLAAAATSANNIGTNLSKWSGYTSTYGYNTGSEGSAMQEYMENAMAAGYSYEEALKSWSESGGGGSLVGVEDPLTKNKGKNEGEAAASGSSKFSDSESGAEIKSLTQQSISDTGTIKTELGKQADLYAKLNESIKKGWIVLEKDGLIHYTALAELSRIRAQAELDYLAECVNFAGENPIVQNKIIMSAEGPDWTPPTFTPVTAPTLEAADFSGVKLLTEGEEKKSTGNESNGSGSNVEFTVYVKNDTSVTSKVTADVTESQGNIALTRRVV